MCILCVRGTGRIKIVLARARVSKLWASGSADHSVVVVVVVVGPVVSILSRRPTDIFRKQKTKTTNHHRLRWYNRWRVRNRPFFFLLLYISVLSACVMITRAIDERFKRIVAARVRCSCTRVLFACNAIHVFFRRRSVQLSISIIRTTNTDFVLISLRTNWRVGVCIPLCSRWECGTLYSLYTYMRAYAVLKYSHAHAHAARATLKAVILQVLSFVTCFVRHRFCIKKMKYCRGTNRL